MCFWLENSIEFKRVFWMNYLVIFSKAIQNIDNIIVCLIKAYIVWLRFSFKIFLLCIKRSEPRNNPNACLQGFHAS